MTETVRVPMALAARKGVSALPEMASDKRVVLTSHGRPVAVVDTAERLDEDARRLRDAAWAVLDWAGDLVAHRSTAFALDEVCDRLGLDPGTVRTRAAERAQQFQDGR